MTTLGQHTIAEAREFAALIEFQVKAEDDLIKKHEPLRPDPVIQGAVARYKLWKERWRSVSEKVLSDLTLISISNPLVPASVQPVEPQYKKLQCAVNKSCDDSHTDPGDMREVMNAVEKALNDQTDQGDFRDKFPANPTGFDPDLASFKTLDAAIKKGEAAAAAAKEGAKSAAFAVPWWLWVLGGVGVLGAGTVVYQTQIKPFLPSTYAPRPKRIE